MYEVLVEDRAEWAVCGRAVGVVDMGHASKQTSVVVEVMALNGGHLLIPRVQIMKYFPASSASKQSTSSQIDLKGKEPRPAYSHLTLGRVSTFKFPRRTKNSMYYPLIRA